MYDSPRHFADLATGLRMAYVVDDHTDPWRNAETLILLHGIAESAEAWRAWVPYLSRHFRVIRPDLRGFGASTPMPLEYEWSLAALADDLDALIGTLGLARVHLAGAKLGGLVAMTYAASRPEKVSSLVISGATVKLDFLAPSIPEKTRRMREQGIRAWAEATMRERMGSGMPAAGVQWWIDYMGEAPLNTVLGVYRMLAGVDITGQLSYIRAPTLVMTAGNSDYYGSVESVSAWQKHIADSELETIPSDSYHISASDPDACASRAAAFLARRFAAPPS